MFSLTALIIKNSYILVPMCSVFLKKTSQVKLETLSIVNVDLSENIGKVVIKKSKF